MDGIQKPRIDGYRRPTAIESTCTGYCIGLTDCSCIHYPLKHRSIFCNVFNVFFYFFPRFLFKKTLSNAKYKYVKIQRKIFLGDDLAMIVIDFGLLRSLYCKISYLLAEEHWSHTHLGIWQPTYDSCAKIIVGFMANVGNVFYPTFTNVFFYFMHVFNVFFKFSSQRLLHLWLNSTIAKVLGKYG